MRTMHLAIVLPGRRTFGKQGRSATPTAAPAPVTRARPALLPEAARPSIWHRIAVAVVAAIIGLGLFCFGLGRPDAKAFMLFALGMFLLTSHQILRCFGKSLPLTRGKGDNSDTTSSSDGSWFGCGDGDGGCGGDGGGD